MNRAMMRSILGVLLVTMVMGLYAQDWSSVPVPANAGEGMVWELQENLSDDFNYQHQAVDEKVNFGENKWYNFYHAAWDGPGTTYWKYNHVEVDGSDLILKATRWEKSSESNPKTSNPNKMGKPEAGVNAGCITSNNKVKYPVFVEGKMSMADITLASDLWLLSTDDTQEIDIIECYGGAYQGNSYFAKFIHLSHHSFIRNPFTDYQPTDKGTWYEQAGISSWGQYCWNNGNRRYVRVGVNWISPFHFEYYIDGELVRVLYDKAAATKKGNVWYYEYPKMVNGAVEKEDGYQKMYQYLTASSYKFNYLEKTNEISTTSVIDPYNYQKGEGFTKEMDIIINIESQNWHVDAGRTPSDDDLNNPAKNVLKMDWIRVYKPKENVTGFNPIENQLKVYPNPVESFLKIDGGDKINNSRFLISSVNGLTQMTGAIINNQINVSTLQHGMYYLKLPNGGCISFLKM